MVPSEAGTASPGLLLLCHHAVAAGTLICLVNMFYHSRVEVLCAKEKIHAKHLI